jgi:Na+-driven multidrug efflux pump
VRWWIELIVSTIAYWVMVAVVVAFLAFFQGDCGAGTTDAERSACLRHGHFVVWTVITVFLAAYVAIVVWWTTRREKSEGR